MSEKCDCRGCKKAREVGEKQWHVVPCPVCGAKTGKCVRPSEHERFSVGYQVHFEREIAALVSGTIEPCVDSNWARWQRGEPLQKDGWFPSKKERKYLLSIGVDFRDKTQMRLL